jgi:hypothetical protein
MLLKKLDAEFWDFFVNGPNYLYDTEETNVAKCESAVLTTVPCVLDIDHLGPCRSRIVTAQEAWQPLDGIQLP